MESPGGEAAKRPLGCSGRVLSTEKRELVSSGEDE
jgi:hypothetical protein